MNYTNHAEMRMQQRGINDNLFWLVDEFGERVFDNHHGEIVYLNKKARQKIREYLGKSKYACIEKKLNAYFVERSGQIITVGHRSKAIKSH